MELQGQPLPGHTGLSDVDGSSFRRVFSIVDADAKTLPSDLRIICAYVYLFDKNNFKMWGFGERIVVSPVFYKAHTFLLI